MDGIIKHYKKLKYELRFVIVERITINIDSNYWNDRTIDKNCAVFMKKREIVVRLYYNNKIIQLFR